MKQATVLLFLIVSISCPLKASRAMEPKEGMEVGWWKLPPEIVAGDDDVCGMAWDGAELWVANYSYQKYNGKAYRLDIRTTEHGGTPSITRVIDYRGNSVEGIDHDHAGHLYVGMRYKQSRASASIVKYNDRTGAEVQRYTSFAYPDGYEICNDYADPDGVVLDRKGNLYWCVKGDHYKERNPTVANTGVQMMTLDGKTVKRFWLPWYYATPAYSDGYFIYKKGGRFRKTSKVFPQPEDFIDVVKVDDVENNAIAKVSKSVKISGAHYFPDQRYLGTTYFDDHLYLINQDTAPPLIIKIYLPLD
jgi:hypothetical protein